MSRYRRVRIEGGSSFTLALADVTRVFDWPFSSFHRYVAEGILPADWAAMREN